MTADNLTPEQIAEWRSKRRHGMQSAIGEYVPPEFWDVLDAYESKARRVAELERELIDIHAALGCDDDQTHAVAMIHGLRAGVRELDRLRAANEPRGVLLPHGAEYVLLEDMCESFDRRYGKGLFATFNSVKIAENSEPSAASEPPIECGACDSQEPCSNIHGICSRHGGEPHNDVKPQAVLPNPPTPAEGHPTAYCTSKSGAAEPPRDVDIGRAMYVQHCESAGIHSNRFPGWNELTKEERNEWNTRAAYGG